MLNKRLYLLLLVTFFISILSSCAVTERAPESSPDVKQTQQDPVEEYIKSNFAQLRSDMAVGEGECLARLATLLAIKEIDKRRFYVLTKNKFNSLFVSPETTAEQLLINLRREVLIAF
ncbi:hypothetical protein BMR02_01410 [Methylococcaceae bacterium HT1]|nr:hypothetical protein BMR02_01410 [Methylococcaceae bacterium HT1]TXL14616.1 hypothetical protein BMR04_12985 [Methylococcaceae bacterium HT3]TXL20553.1 hypothetical protein BMR03_14325 [Methylococcaceae bacterium HT2]